MPPIPLTFGNIPKFPNYILTSRLFFRSIVIMSENHISGIHLWLVLWKAYKALETVDKRSIESLGLDGISDFAVLEILLHKGPLPVNTIGRRVMLTSGSITTAVDRVEKRGWVRRKHSQNDRRVVEVHLTDKGRRLIENAFATHAETMERIAAPLDAKERDQLISLLKKIGFHAARLSQA